jgi:glyoxylase-like metal-dependent hydrolase (beta-lactamase superfamily II)
MEVYRLVFSPIEVNTYIFADDSGESAVIDCGCYNEKEFDRLTRFIELKNYRPILLLNTHCHLDHVFGNRFMLEKYNLRTLCSEEEMVNLKNSPAHAEFFGLAMDEPPEPAGYLKDGDTVQVGSVILKAIHVPGHTAGSLAYYCEQESCIFAGDVIFSGGIGRTDLPGGNHQKLLKSIREKILVLPPSTVIYSGHGPATTVGNELKRNPFLT